MKSLTTEKSRQMFMRASESIAGGVESRSRGKYEGYDPYPPFIERAEGSKIYDIDGNEYIDYLQALGATILGHANPRILNFVVEQIKKGTIYGLPHELEIKVAEKLVKDVPCFERVGFVNSGSEAVQMVLRLARAHTGKDKVIKFEGHYHGWMDNICVSALSPLETLGPKSNPNIIPAGLGLPKNAYKDLIILPWNDLDIVEKTIKERKDEIAAIITEPHMGNGGCIPPEDGYLEGMRRLTQDNNIVLIFDEVITGFRLALGGAQQVFNVTPDLSTAAKALAGGFALSAYGGRAEIMDLITKGDVLHAGTLNANRVVIAGTYATLNLLEEENGKIYKKLYQTANKLAAGMRDIIKTLKIEAMVQGTGPMLHIYFTNLERIKDYRDTLKASEEIFLDFAKRLFNNGIFVRPRRVGNIYISAAHTEADIDKTLEVVEKVLNEMKEEKIV